MGRSTGSHNQGRKACPFCERAAGRIFNRPGACRPSHTRGTQRARRRQLVRQTIQRHQDFDPWRGPGSGQGQDQSMPDCRAVDSAQLVREIGAADAWSQVLVTGSPAVLRELRGASDGRLALLLAWNPSDGTQVLDELRPAAVDLSAAAVNADLCRKLHERGIKVRCRNLGQDNTPAAWDAALGAGADYLLSDTPEEVIARVLAKRLTPRPVRFTCHRG